MFKGPFEEREVLIEVAPGQFFFTQYYRSHPMILVHTERFDPDWARADIVRVWRAMAPKPVLIPSAVDPGRMGQRRLVSHGSTPCVS